MPLETDITLIGGGLVGSLLAVFLRKKGIDVTLYESRPDIRLQYLSTGLGKVGVAFGLRLRRDT